MRKLIVATIAVMSMAAPQAAGAASFTVVQHSPDATPVAFHVQYTPFACCKSLSFAPRNFTLVSGASKTFTDVPKGYYTITEAVAPGRELRSVTCTADPDPEDAPVVSGSSVRLELSKTESKTCTFVNVNTPTSTGTPPATPTTPAPPAAPGASTPPAAGAPPQAPTNAVSPERVVNANAALRAPRTCVSRRYTVTVVGGPVRTVSFSVNGRRVRTIRARSGQRRFSVTLSPRVAVQRVVARVVFRSNANLRTRTLRATVRRCARSQVSPQFTG